MRKTYQMFLALVMCLLGATSANAGEMISLQEVPFCTWDGWNADAKSTGDADCAWVLNESTGQPYGDSRVNNYADLTMYAKLVVTVTEGAPRLLFNRDEADGQWNEDESKSHLIDNTKSGWSDKYFSQEGNTYTVDLKQMTKDKGFCHLHAIKGANWANVTIESMEVEKVGKAKQIGWVNLINNSDMEGDDVSSFFTKVSQGSPEPSVITDGVGMNGSRGIVVEATAKVADAWDNQFWFRFNEVVAPDAKYRVSFNYRADSPASASTQAHAEPSDYIHYEMLGNVDFTTEWQTFTAEGTVTASQAGPNQNGGLFTSIAFNLNEYAEANNYYFDNIVFEVYKAGITAEYSSDVIMVDFGFDTNIADLVKAGGKPRLLFPNDCAAVKVDGEPMNITTVEGFADGRFYIFTEEAIEGNEVVVTLKNPADQAYHLIYINGPGGDVPNFEDVAEENDEVAMKEDAYSYLYVKPTVLSADPEDGSFNLPNDIKVFKLTFDKEADCAKIQATMGKEKLTVSPAEGFAKEVTLTRTGTGDLATGAYMIKVTNIFCEQPLVEDDFTEYEFTINVGKVEYDPTDVAKEIIPVSFFEDCANGGVPEGFILYADGDPAEERTSDNTYSSGNRIMTFADGGDFIKGLYMRTYYTIYGKVEGHDLQLEAGKKYKVSFNTCRWASAGQYLKFQILDESENVVMEEVVENNPNMNEKYNAISKSTAFEKTFIPDASGKYFMKWIVAKNAEGEDANNDWANGVILGNVKVMYVPNQVGIEETQKFNDALANAKTVRDENTSERYAGAAFTALDETITKYEAEGEKYTAPSAYLNAAAALNEAAQAVKDHRALCDSYDEQIKKSIDVVRENAESKFAVTELYGQLKAINEKYHAYSELQENPDPESESEYAYFYDKLTDDAQLTDAVKELNEAAQVAGYMFTEGPSLTSSDVGIKVLVDRIRQGVEGLTQLGVAEDDELIVRANKAVTDDDDLAEELKNRIMLEFYSKMKDGVNLFPETVDESTLETTTPTYNFTVFAKNPNTYCWKGSTGVTEENCPGWTVSEGSVSLTDMWNTSGYPGDIDGLPKDLCFTQYHQVSRVEQTITDLPAGVYTVMIDAAEWSDEFTPGEEDTEEQIAEKEANHELNRVYVKTSDTPAFEEGQESPEEFKADARIDHYGQYVGRHENNLTDIEVVDGYLTIGVKWNNLGQYMFDRIQIFLTNPAAGFDYAGAYATGIDLNDAKPAKVRSIELYDLNGRRLPVAKQKGVLVVKKIMSDGSIRTEKVVK